MAIIKESVDKDMEKLEPPYSVSGNESGAATKENNLAITQKVYTALCKTDS